MSQEKPTRKVGSLVDVLRTTTAEIRAELEGRSEIWLERPVAPKEFFERWMTCPPYPLQQEAIDEMLVEGDGIQWSTKYNEAYLLWGMGSGKDFTASRIMIYVIYWLLCLKEPQKYFGLGEKAALDLINVSFNEDQAQFVYFSELKKGLNSVINPKTGKKWFEEKGMSIKETSKQQMIQFPKYITAYSLNSKEYQMEGKNVLVAVFDEIAAFKINKADEIFKNLKGNMRSRFPREHKLICISYKRDDYDYMMIRWDATKTNPKVFRSGPYATWEVNLRVGQEDFKEAYDTNPEDAERRYECKGSTIKSGFFKYKDKITEMSNKKRMNPIIEPSYCVRDLLGTAFHDWFVGNPNRDYVAHIDLAKGLDSDEGNADCAGLAMGHLEPTEDENRPRVVIDLMIQIKAVEKGKEIIFEDIRQFLYVLKQERRFPITKVTLDGYQSTDFMQMLANKGIKTELISVDITTGPYDTMKGLMYSGRLDYYTYSVFIRECEELKLVNRKIDHPEISRRRAMEEGGDERGSKDVSDAVSAVVVGLIGMPKKAKTGFEGLTSDVSANGAIEEVESSSGYRLDDREYGKNYKINDEEDD